jgi:two-component system OmpR family sensor kinase
VPDRDSVGNGVQGSRAAIDAADAVSSPLRSGPHATLRGRLILGAIIGLLAAAVVFAIVSSDLIRSQTARASRASFDQQAERVAALISTKTEEQAIAGNCQNYTPADLQAFVGPGAHLFIDSPPLCPGGTHPQENLLAADGVKIDPSALASQGYQHVDFRAPGATTPTVATAAPVRVAGQSVGAIILTKPASAVSTSWSEVVPNLLLGAVIGFVPALALTLLITSRLTRPLREMEFAVDRVAGGDLTASVPPAGTEELDHVARAFNSMVGRLRERDDRARAFLMNVTHDLRTPLTAIRGHAAALRDGIVPPGQVDRSLGAIESEAKRLEDMVSDLLDLARIDADQFRIAPTTVNPGEILTEARAAQMAVADHHRVEFEQQISPLTSLVTDPKRFRQIIDNLLENAIRWTPAGGTVTLEAHTPTSGGISVTVADTGPGVPTAQREAIFAAFHAQASPDGRTGAGLGLAICRQLARALGGEVHVEEASHGGAAFVVQLPATAPPHAHTPLPNGESATGASPLS